MEGKGVEEGWGRGGGGVEDMGPRRKEEIEVGVWRLQRTRRPKEDPECIATRGCFFLVTIILLLVCEGYRGAGLQTAVAVNNRTRGSDGMKYVAENRSSKGDDIMPDHRLTDRTTTHMELGGFGNVCDEDQL